MLCRSMLRAALVLLLSNLPSQAQTPAASDASATDPDCADPGAPVERDNLVHAEGTHTVPLGAIGRHELVGHGPRAMVLFPGFGMDAEVYDAFARRNAERYTMLLVTPPGFGATDPPPMPAAGTRYRERTWCRAFETSVWKLAGELGLERPLLVGHLDGLQHALCLAIEHPGDVAGIISLCGELVRDYGDGVTPEQRAELIDEKVAETWFKTVDEETWRQGMGLPSWYSADEELAASLFEACMLPKIPSQVRYLVEKWSLDPREAYLAAGVPTLALLPDAQAAPHDEMYCYFTGTILVAPWEGLPDGAPVELHRMQGARQGLVIESVDAVSEFVARFVDGLE